MRMRDGFDRFVGSWRNLTVAWRGRGQWSVHGFVGRSQRWTRWVDRFMGSWCDLTVAWRGRGRRFDWCDLELDGAISNSLCLRVCEAFLFLFLSLRVFGNDLKVKQKLKIFSRSKGLFYSQSKWFSRKLYFPCATKHTVSCKRISWNCFQPKQTQP